MFPSSQKSKHEPSIDDQILHSLADTMTVAHMSGIHFHGKVLKFVGPLSEIVAEIAHNHAHNLPEKIICGAGVALVKEAINVSVATQVGAVAGTATSMAATPAAGAMAAVSVGITAYKFTQQITEPIGHLVQHVCHDVINVSFGFQPYQQAVSLYYQQKYQDALSKVNEAIRINPNFTEAHSLKGLCHHSLNQYKKSIKAYNQALQLSPTNHWLYFNRAIAHAKQNAVDQALNDINRFLNVEPSHLSGLALKQEIMAIPMQSVIQADQLFQAKIYQKALSLLEEVLKTRPTFARAHCIKGSCLRELGRLNEALAAYQQALILSTDDEWIYYNQAQLYEKMGKLNEYDDCMSKFYQISHQKELVARHFSSLAQQEAYEKAKAQGFKAEANNLFRAGQYRIGLDVILKAKAICPKDGWIHCIYGSYLRKLKRFKEAEEAYGLAEALVLKQDSNIKWLYFNKAELYKEWKKPVKEQQLRARFNECAHLEKINTQITAFASTPKDAKKCQEIALLYREMGPCFYAKHDEWMAKFYQLKDYEIIRQEKAKNGWSYRSHLLPESKEKAGNSGEDRSTDKVGSLSQRKAHSDMKVSHQTLECLSARIGNNGFFSGSDRYCRAAGGDTDFSYRNPSTGKPW